MECANLKHVLNDYEIFSGQAINYNKSGVFFSHNVPPDKREELSDILEVYSSLNTGRYLGLSSLIGRNKKHVFNYIKERLWVKLQGWRSKKLSRAGREVLIKSVVQSLPTFCMSTFLLPSTLLNELHVMMNAFWWGSGSEESKGIKWLNWRKLCVPKKYGGRGFRDLHLFNTALLGKIAWRLLSEPEALVSKVLKAKYYPHTSFMDARIGSNPSFSWRGIIEAQDLLRRGLRWKVGDGTNISIWGQTWLRDEGSFYVQTPRMLGHEHNRVCDLFISGSHTWNRALIFELFSARDAQAILRTPISPNGGIDRLIWHGSRDGRYTVKEGYKLADNLTREEEYVCDGEWNQLWNLDAPPKVKDFVWRLCRDILPTRDKLVSKGIVTETICACCNTELETQWHVLFGCVYAKECWRNVGLDEKIENCITLIDSCSELIFKLLASLSNEDKLNFVTVAWQIWQECNNRVWSNTMKPAWIASRTALALVNEWQQTQARHRPVRTAACRAWHAPSENCLKINVDAAMFDDTIQTGLGMVIRDDLGVFIAAKTILVEGYFDAEIGEEMGFLETLSWVKELGLSNVVVEGDSKLVSDAIAARSGSLSSVGDYIMSCVNLADNIVGCKINVVNRDANSLAHAFARASRSFGSSSTWVEPPAFVDGLPVVACTCGP